MASTKAYNLYYRSEITIGLSLKVFELSLKKKNLISSGEKLEICCMHDYCFALQNDFFMFHAALWNF